MAADALRVEVGVHVGGRRRCSFSLAIFIGFNNTSAAAAVKVEPASTAEAADVPPEEMRSRVITLLAVFIISIVFWLAFYQIFYTFTFWAARQHADLA